METNSPRSRKRTRVNDNDEVPLVQVFKRPRIEASLIKLQNESYTIAWICALPIEMAAANAMLDGVHPSLPSNAKDSNSYILGNVGRHNIVVACLPADHYGTNSAAVVANNLIRTFPSIRIGLMVGIGGGVPGSVDVRLGDIVVGYNVIQHDLGKVIQGSRVHRTGTPKSPPSSVLAAVSKLRAIHESNSSRVPDFLQQMIIKHPKMTKYTCPSPSQDRLFLATYSHSQEKANCDSCDTSMLVYRPPRMDNHPVIHYGNVASGNQVMKDAISRDEIAQELNVICFEMEAAGLVDALPCLVIRGICDYSDSHKNKEWQEYAAATAAAYAKELLIEAVPEAVIEQHLKSSDSCLAEPETALAPWQVSSSQWTAPQLQQLIPILFQQQLCQQLPLSPVLVIDSRGCYLPFYLETIDSKELFVEILRHRFKDLGTNKIERGEWTLEYQQSGQCLDLSKDWQSVIKPNQILNMRMIFRRQNHSSTKCPSCGFMNPGLQSDQVQCRRCSLNFRRIEEIQDIRISSDSSNTQTDLVEVSAARFQRPRPPKPQNPEDDICRYKQVQLVDVDFKIGLPTVDQLVMKTALKLNSGDLSDIEYLAERLALAYGLSEADSHALSQMIDVQHAHIRSLQRHTLDSDTDSNIVLDLGSKSKQTDEVDFDTADLRDNEFSGLRLQDGDVARGIYKWTEQAEAKTRVQRSRSFDHLKPESESNALDLNAIRAPGGFRRDYLRRDIISPSGDQMNGYKGADSSGTNRAPLTSNFVEFLSMYGQFAGEDLEEDNEALSPNEYTQSDITTHPGDVGKNNEQMLGSSKHHSNAQEILSSVNAYKRPLTPSEVKGVFSMGDTVHNQEPNISLDMAMPETPTWPDPSSPVIEAVHPKLELTESPPPEIPSAQIRPVSVDAVLAIYLGGDSHPEIAYLANRRTSLQEI